MNFCTACGRDFHSVSAFDQHRVGKYPQTGPSEYTDRLDQGLVGASDDWRPDPEFGRRCLTPEEMQERGMQKDERCSWRLPVRGTPPWASDVGTESDRKPPTRPIPPPRPPQQRRGRTSPRSPV
jgi:hypothetical protein